MCPENVFTRPEEREGGGWGFGRGVWVFNNLTQPRLNRVTPPLLITSPLTSCHLGNNLPAPLLKKKMCKTNLCFSTRGHSS